MISSFVGAGSIGTKGGSAGFGGLSFEESRGHMFLLRDAF